LQLCNEIIADFFLFAAFDKQTNQGSNELIHKLQIVKKNIAIKTKWLYLSIRF
jgi:hypothetical protein